MLIMFCLSIYLYVVLSSEGPCILIFISKARKVLVLSMLRLILAAP